MQFLKQLTIILAISFLAEILSATLPVKIPSSIYGLIIMFLSLYLRIIKVSQVRQTAAFFMEIMPVIFIPASAALLLAWDKIMQNLTAFITIVIVSTIVIIAVSGFFTQIVYTFTLKRAKKKILENLHEKKEETL